jgi:HEAT repeat protein
MYNKKKQKGNKRLNGNSKKKGKRSKMEITAHEKKKEILRTIQDTEDIDEILVITHNEDPVIRLKAIQELCPCRVGKDIDRFWLRLFEMVDDVDDKVREQVLHNLCDGSPPHMESKVEAALEYFNKDPNSFIRRRAHKVLASYQRTGKWNIL